MEPTTYFSQVLPRRLPLRLQAQSTNHPNTPSPMPYPQRRTLGLGGLAITCALLLFSCGGPPATTSTEPIAQSGTARAPISALDSLYFLYDEYKAIEEKLSKKNLLTDALRDSLMELRAEKVRLLGRLGRYVDKTTWKAAKDSFSHRFDNDRSDDSAFWPEDAVMINVASFFLEAGKYTVARNDIDYRKDTLPGVMFHYGTTPANKLTLGVEFIKLAWLNGNRDTLTYEEEKGGFYSINPATGVLVSSDIKTWRMDNWTKRYFANVGVRLSDGTYGPVVLNRDAHAEAFLMPYFRFLSDMNNGGGGNFVVSSACDPSFVATEDSIPHRLMIHVVDAAGQRRLDDVEDNNNDALNKALELGSPCPPRCKRLPYR